MTFRTFLLLTTLAFFGTCVLAAPTSVEAQSSAGATMAAKGEPLPATFKGSVGLGLIGAELGFVIPALIGARQTWEFIVFPLLGAAGGAAGGYFLLERGAGHPEAAVGVLVAGMALLVPAMVITIAETAYEPDEEEIGKSAATQRAMAAAEAGPGLVRWSTRGLMLAPPMVAASPSVGAKEALRTGATRAQAWQVSLLSGRF